MHGCCLEKNMSMSHCFILPMVVRLRDRRCKMMLLSEGFGMASEEKSDSPLFHSFGFVGSPSEMDLRKETTSGVQIFQLFCRVAVLHMEIGVNSWYFSAHMSMQMFERWPQLQWVSEIPFTDLWCVFESVQRLCATFQLECLSLPQHHLKVFCSWKWVWAQEKTLLAHILRMCAKMHSTEAKVMWVRLFLSTRLRLAEGVSLHKYTAEIFSSPSSTQGVCAASREAIASAALCCFQNEPSSAMPTSSTYAPSVKSSECSWTAKVPPVKFSTALEPRFIRPVTQNHCYRFSMRVRWGVEMTVFPLISKGMERWQGHRRSIKILKLL